jgi:hypothetical protein
MARSREIDKSFTSNIRMVESYPAYDAFRLASIFLAYNHEKVQILIKPYQKLLTNKMA